MKLGNLKTLLSLVVLGAAILACGIPSRETGPAEAPTVGVQETSDEGGAPPDVPSIRHEVIPVDFPANQSSQAGDFDSSKVLENNSLIGGDRFTFNRFERPFNANTMNVYFSQLDIVNTQVYQDDIWIYGKLSLKELGASSSQNEKYALELDVRLNGKGDWFILANKPESTEWTVKGVKVYQDANRDVGGELPALTDKNPVQGDGFETLVFDQGQGEDPDTAWVRISPNDPNTIEFAVNKSALDNPTKFMINMWAGTTLLDPALFDLNDRFTHEQAGAADKGLEFFYPIKEVAEIDNSCRMAVGFQPTGNEAGICPVPQKEQQGAPVPPGTSCPPNTFLFCNNGVCFCFPIFIFPTPIPPPP